MNDNKKVNVVNGVMLNAYPDSIGNALKDCINMLKLPEFKDAFSLFYILPTFFNSDLDRGFSIIDYDLNNDLVSKNDINDLKELGIGLKFDIVLNHLSVASPQFKDLLENGEQSKYKDFFINWNDFWRDHGEQNEEGVVVPKKDYLEKLFMRKAGLPILKVAFPDGSERPYWNTFYQKVTYEPLKLKDIIDLEGVTKENAGAICEFVNSNLQHIEKIQFGEYEEFKTSIIKILKQNRTYLGQMDVNAKSQLVWDFYEETLTKLKNYGCSILRLDAFAYLHKEVGETNFFNEPGTWDYLNSIKGIADKNNLSLLPEIHAEYGSKIHDEVASRGYQIYDFFLPGLVIHTLENQSNTALLHWAREIQSNNYRVVNMLGCHDGIPVLDLRGKEDNGSYNKGLLTDTEIESLMNLIIERGGKVKNLYGPNGEKISYYQVNATYFSALGEDSNKMLVARAIQLFMPGIPQVWYLDIFEGKNDYEAVERAGEGGHKEINRTNLSITDVENGLKKASIQTQIELIKLRNTHKAFLGELKIYATNESQFSLIWQNYNDIAELKVDLKLMKFDVWYSHPDGKKHITY